MRLVADGGAWTIGPSVSDPPAVAVLEVSGAVLQWTVDDPAGPDRTRITVTDMAAADWMWRVVGPSGHAAMVAALRDGRGEGGVEGEVELVGVDLRPESLAPLRRLAIGHWLRRWWPESRRDGIVRLDPALLDGELAVLVSAADEYFTEDTLDSDVSSLLAPHRAALLALDGAGDPRVDEIVTACWELADDLGVWDGDEPPAPTTSAATERRDDYALAAGGSGGRTAAAIARGIGSVDWVAVPPGVFDAADQTIEWTVESADAAVLAMIRVALTGERAATGIEVRLRSGQLEAAGVLNPEGTAALTVVDPADLPVTETRAWDHDWSVTTVRVGAAPVGWEAVGREPANQQAAPAIRQRVRALARRRLTNPGPDAFLAEIVAAESDY